MEGGNKIMPSSNIDKRIVEMDFDNARFERNCNQSISTLDKLKNALNLGDAAKGFNALEKQANSIDFSGLERSINNIEKRFSTLGIVGATVITNLTNRVVNSVANISHTIFGLAKSGGINRALNLEHANFMLNGLLKDASKVAEIINGPVNNAVSGTAYGLDAAANAAAQFVASGVTDMQKLENALTGISGVAAMTSASYEEISSIFTTVAGQGKVMTMQLRQIEARGLNAAAALGEYLGKSEAEVRDMVTKGEISFETFAEAMNNAFGDQAKKANETFTGAMSNVKAALSRIGAKIATPALENIRKIFVDLITVINNTSKTLQPFIDFVNNGIGSVTNKIRGVLTQTERLDSIVSNIVSGMGESIKVIYSYILPIKRALDDIIPKKTLDDAIALTAAISGIISTLKLSEDQMITVTRIFRGLFAVADILLNVVSSIIKAVFPAASGLKGLAGGILEVLATIGDYIYAIDLVIKKNNIFGELFGLVANKVKYFISVFKGATKISVPSFGQIFGQIGEALKTNGTIISKAANVIKIIFNGLLNVLGEFSPLLKSFAGMIGRGLGEIGNAFEKVFSGGGFGTLLALINSGILVSIVLKISKFIEGIGKNVESGTKIFESINGFISSAKGMMDAMSASFKADIFVKAAQSIALLVGSLVTLSLIDPEALTRSIIAISFLFGGLIGIIYAFTKIADSLKQNAALITGSLSFAAIGASILLLASAMKVLSGIDADSLGNGLLVITGLIAELLTVAMILSNFGEKMNTGVLSIIAFAAAIKILGTAVAQVGKVPVDELKKGLAGITVAIIELTAASFALGKSGAGINAGAGMVLMAASLNVISSAISKIGKLPIDTIKQGLGGIAAALVELGIFMKVIGSANHVISTSVAIGILSVSLLAIANAMKAIGNLNILQLVTAIGGIGIVLSEFGIALEVLSSNALGILAASTAIGIMAISLNALLPILLAFANMDIKQFAMAIGGLALSLTVLGGAAAIMGTFWPVMLTGAGVIAALGAASLVSAAGMAASAVALGLIGAALSELNSIGWLDLLSGIGKLAVVFTVLGVSAIALAPCVATMIGLAGALLGIGIAANALALSVSVCAIGLQMMATAMQSFESISWDALNKGLAVLLTTLLGLGVAAVVLAPLSPVILAIGAGIAMIGAGALMTAAALALFGIAINNLSPYISQLSETIKEFAANAWTYISQALTYIWNNLLDFLAKIGQFGIDIGAWLLKGLISGTKAILFHLVDLGGQMLKALGVPEDWVNVATNFVKGLINGLANGLTSVVEKAKELGKGILNGIKEVLKIHSPSEEGDDIGGYFDQGLINGIKRLKGDVVASVADVGQGMKDQATIDANSVMSIWGSVTNGKKSLTNSEKKAAADDLSASSAMQEKLNAKKRESTKVTEESTNALLNEASALSSNSKATGSSTKAKEENAVANETKTAAIDDESESLNEETEAVDDNRQAILEQAEAIEVITEKFDDLINYQRYNDGFKTVKKLTKAFSSFWSNGLDGGFTKKSDVNKSFNKLADTLNKTTKYAKKGVYAFNENGKYLKKLSATYNKNGKKIENQVLKTGRTLIKVTDGQAKIFEKGGSGIEKYTIRVTKNIKNMGKQITKAKTVMADFANMNIPEFVLNTDDAETFINKLRDIQDIFVKKSSMPKQVQDFLGTINFKMAEVSESMNILGKNIDNVGNYMSKKSQSTAYVQDAFISLAATLYDGSDAANEYATEHAKLLFLLENGEATEDEVAAHFESYIKRITDCLVEYRNSIEENLRGSFDVWTEFDKNLLDENEDLISNIESQIAGVTQWSAMLMELSKRGMDMNILKVLTDEGTASYGKLKKLLSMTSDELALFTQRYKQSETAITTARDTALAALANATTRASQRAASKSGKISLAQLKVSKKAAKEMIDDAKAVADNQARYNSLTKKEEKKYLASLTVEEQKAYKKRLKAQKKAFKAEKKAAAREEAKRAEESRVSGILEGIKSMNDYLVVMKKYYDDSNVINKLNEQVAEAFKDISGAVSETTVYTDSANNAILRFAESLDDTGTDGLNYFEELIARVQKFMDEIKSAITNVNLLTTAFGSAESTSIQKIYENALSNVIGDSQVSSLMDMLKSKGYSTEVMEDVISTWKSDRAAGVELMRSLASADEEYVKKINAAYDKESELATALADKAVGVMASTTGKSGLESNLEVAKQQVTDATKTYNDAVSKLNTAKDSLSSKQTELSKINRLNKLMNKDQSKLTKKEKKELKSLKKAYADFAKKSSTQRTNYITALQQEITTLQNDITTYSREVSDASSDVTAATEAQSKAQAELNDYLNKMQQYYDRLISDAKLKQWFDNTATSVEALRDAMDGLNSSSDEFIYAKGKVSEVLEDLTGAIAVYNDADSFVNIKSVTGISNSLSVIEDGLLSFGETLIDVTESSDDFWDSLKKGLEDYQAQLKSTIASSSDFFSMFSGFADEDNPLTATNYLEYADSQIEALNTWQENLKKLADMGLNKEILEKFAAQGLSSYEQVNAWVNATTQQIGEYNKQWEDYNNLVESAADSAMAAIGAAWSKAGQSLQDSMISSFLSNGSDRLTEAGYEASAMIISGVENGLTNAMPELISAVEKTSTSSIATAVGKTVGTAINQGLVASITASVTDTVNAAIEKFKMAVDSVNSYITDTLDTDYTITIHVDTSEMDAAIARMNEAVRRTNTVANTTSQAVTDSAANQQTVNNTTESTQVVNNVTYEQTINSPTAMNQVEIYRESQAVANQIKSTLALANG